MRRTHMRKWESLASYHNFPTTFFWNSQFARRFILHGFTSHLSKPGCILEKSPHFSPLKVLRRIRGGPSLVFLELGDVGEEAVGKTHLLGRQIALKFERKLQGRRGSFRLVLPNYIFVYLRHFRCDAGQKHRSAQELSYQDESDSWIHWLRRIYLSAGKSFAKVITSGCRVVEMAERGLPLPPFTSFD